MTKPVQLTRAEWKKIHSVRKSSSASRNTTSMENQHMEQVIAQDKLLAVVERIKARTTSLIAESRALGFTHNGPLREALRALLGREPYDALLAALRPPKSDEARATAPRVTPPARVRPDDSAARVVDSMKASDGWTYRYVFEHEPRPVRIKLTDGDVTLQDSGEKFRIMKDPDGIEFVRALDTEPAEIVRALPGGDTWRGVRWEISATRHRIEAHLRRNDRELDRAEEAKVHKKRAKVKHAEKIEALIEKPVTPTAPKRARRKS